jgi:hypothetical protein
VETAPSPNHKWEYSTPLGLSARVRDIKTGVGFGIGTGFTAQDRVEMFDHRPLGILAKYKHFPVGAK